LLRVLRSDEVTLAIERLVVLALVKVDEAATTPPLKVLSDEKIFAVVVEKAVVKAPVVELYASGYEAESDEEEILLLKVAKSVFERKPLVVRET
jgi:hypothetical protein